ncbi:MAG: acyltransferase family protein [Candidatus Gastranaerophilales bacterium]|nr:acyltransferase family protein [Candidatus Gastranaerophilales bacterium]
MSDRIKWLDIAKGIGIIFVIFAHVLTISPALLNYIYSFHMPLFFFISGYLFSDTKYKTLKDFSKKKAQTLLVPYFIFSAVSFIYWALIQTRMGDDIQHPNLFHAFIGIFYSNPADHAMSYNVALWFLTCLFCTEILFFIVKKRNENKHHLIISLVLFSILGYLYSLYVHFNLPWSIDVAFSAVVFYGVGYLFKTVNKNDYFLQKFSRIPVLLIVVAVNYFLSQINHEIDMASNELHNYFLFYTGAFLGIFSWISVSFLIKESKYLSYIGKNSLIIFGLHLKVPADFLDHKLLEINARMVNGNIYGIINTIITLLFMIPVIWVINRFFPFITGKGRKIADELTVKEEISIED